jgi:YHS domain-containing protein
MRDGTTRAAFVAQGFACALLLCWSVPNARAGEPHSIAWRTSFEQAQAEARSQKRPLWIQFTGSWCPFCRQMERETFPKSEIVAYSRDHFVPVMLRAESREDLMAHFGVSGLPATVVLSPTGEVLGKHEGFLEPAELSGFLNERRPQKANRAEIALAGYCPVALVEGRVLKEGKAHLALSFEGRTYRFADARGRELFQKDPERFAPSNAGRCAVSQVERKAVVAGSLQFGVFYRDRLFLCVNEDARQRFLKDPERFAYVDVADNGFCPHCRSIAGRSVRGVPRYMATHSGRRYYFPDSVHLEAFRASPEKFIR